MMGRTEAGNMNIHRSDDGNGICECLYFLVFFLLGFSKKKLKTLFSMAGIFFHEKRRV